MTAQERSQLREMVANLYCAGGCGCCQDTEGWNAASEALGRMLKVRRYEDSSGRDWYRYRKEKK